MTRAGNSGSSPIMELQPETRIPPAWFTVIQVPSTIAPIGAGQSAWYLLRRVRAQSATQLTLQLIRAYLKATNSTPGSGYGIAAGNCAAWGDVTEPAAWIVVGKNLPGNVDANGSAVWTPAPADLPGIEQSTGGVPAAISIGSPAEYAARIPFPSGKWSDTNGAPLLPLAIPFGVGQFPLVSGDTLDVALVVRGSQITTAAVANKYVVGLAHIELVCNQRVATNKVRYG